MRLVWGGIGAGAARIGGGAVENNTSFRSYHLPISWTLLPLGGYTSAGVCTWLWGNRLEGVGVPRR